MDVWYVCCDWIMLKKLTYCEHLWTYFLQGIFQTKQPLHLHRRIPRSLHHISFSSWSCPYARLQDLRFASVLKFPYVSKWATAWYRTIIFNILWTYYEHIAIVYVTNDDRQALELWVLMFFWWFLCGCPMLSHNFRTKLLNWGWDITINSSLQRGIRRFYECGPGHSLKVRHACCKQQLVIQYYTLLVIVTWLLFLRLYPSIYSLLKTNNMHT